MIKMVKFVSQLHMENLEAPCLNTAVISITAPGDHPARIKEGFNSVLRLQFDDLYEEIIHEAIGAIPDANPDGYVLWHNLRLPDANHAKAILEFLDTLTCERLIVHCHAGVSRSAAVAQFVSDKYNADLDGDTSCANKRLLRLLNKHNDCLETWYGKYIPGGEMATVGDQDDFDFDFQWLNAQVKRK